MTRRCEQIGQDGQRRIARRQRRQDRLVQRDIAAGQKAAVRLPADDALVNSSAAKLVKGRDDIGRADLGLLQQNFTLAQAALDRIVGADRHRRGIRAQILGNDEAQ